MRVLLRFVFDLQIGLQCRLKRSDGKSVELDEVLGKSDVELDEVLGKSDVVLDEVLGKSGEEPDGVLGQAEVQAEELVQGEELDGELVWGLLGGEPVGEELGVGSDEE